MKMPWQRPKPTQSSRLVKTIKEVMRDAKCIELRLEDGHVARYVRSGMLSANQVDDLERGLAAGMEVRMLRTTAGFIVVKHPPARDDRDLPYPMPLSATEPVTLIISAQADGDMPVEMHRVRLPPGYFLEGIKGYSANESVGKET